MAERRYYILVRESTNDNVALWWRPERKGYTRDLDRAGVYGEAEARKIQALRDLDWPVPMALARLAATPQVNIDRLVELARARKIALGFGITVARDG